MTTVLLSLFVVSLFIADPESRGQDVLASRSSGRKPAMVLAYRGTGRLQPATVLAYRGTGRLGCYRASERG